MKKPITASGTVHRLDFAGPEYYDNLPLLLEDIAAYLRASKVWVWDITIHDETHFTSKAPDGQTKYRAEVYCEVE